MLYELIGIVRPGNLAEVREIVLTAGQTVLRQGGVIRGVANWGVFALPRTVTVHQMQHSTGQYFAMRFDSSAETQEQIRRVLRTDPRMIRYASVKLGDGKLQTTAKFGGIDWARGGWWGGKESDQEER